jgi:hypothetical protein
MANPSTTKVELVDLPERDTDVDASLFHYDISLSATSVAEVAQAVVATLPKQVAEPTAMSDPALIWVAVITWFVRSIIARAGAWVPKWTSRTPE